MKDLKSILNLLADGKTLTIDQANAAFDLIMSGSIDTAQIAAFLMGMRMRGEAVDEITGGAMILRSKADKINAPEGSIDTCGTGGDGTGTYNISTTAAIVAAACGVPVAKHGNRSVSSKSGSSEVLEALGINLEMPTEANEACLREHNIAFMFAPSHHRAMRHVGPVRASMGMRTIFNLLGPLANPAMTKRQVLGVFDKAWVRPMAEVLLQLGSEHVWVVHGSDGLDELTITGKSYVAELKDGEIKEFEIDPTDYGLSTATLADIQGGDASVNAQAMHEVLNGAKNAYRDIVLLNAGAALVVADKADNLQEAIIIAAKAIDSGKAMNTLANWIDFTQRYVKG